MKLKTQDTLRLQNSLRSPLDVVWTDQLQGQIGFLLRRRMGAQMWDQLGNQVWLLLFERLRKEAR